MDPRVGGRSSRERMPLTRGRLWMVRSKRREAATWQEHSSGGMLAAKASHSGHVHSGARAGHQGNLVSASGWDRQIQCDTLVR
mmetsp:Transcript_77750/g.196328  ORF Transcript_77750/g.196328 Transcript_77750/m.196328 type:complete len:83 (+) Transcript_77750:423-671(+)